MTHDDCQLIPARGIFSLVSARSKAHEYLSGKMRLKEANKVVQDYVLLPAADTAKPYLTLSDGALARHKAVCADTMNELIRNIEAKFKSSSHAAPSKPTRPNKRRKPCRPKTKNVHARR